MNQNGAILIKIKYFTLIIPMAPKDLEKMQREKEDNKLRSQPQPDKDISNTAVTKN